MNLEKCPECGSKTGFDKNRLPKYKEKTVEIHEQCFDCGYEDIEEDKLKEIDKRNCPICGKYHMPHNKVGIYYVCDECYNTKTIIDKYFDFGLVIPKETDIVFQHQTCGIRCSQVFVEGVFIKLPYPEVQEIDLMHKLSIANYHFEEERAEELWKAIDEFLENKVDLVYEDIEAPEGERYDRNQEGMKWIRIENYDDCDRRLSNLSEEEVVMFYLNSD